MPLCVVKNCKNRTASRPVLGEKKINNIMNLSYHRLPKNEKLKLLWLDSLELNAESVAVGARICSIHFAQDAFHILNGFKRLRPNALPSIEPVIEHEIIVSQSTKSNSLKIDRATSPIPGCSHFVDKSTSMSPKRKLTSVHEEYFQNRFQYMKNHYLKKIKLLQQQVRRKECKIISFEAIFNALKEKNMLQTEELQVLQDIGGPNSKILERQLQKNRGKCVKKQFNNHLKSFALTLHYYSPKAYEYVRKEFDNCLPHYKTISKWYQNIEGKPGIMLESVNAIKQRANKVDYQLFGSLVFDEMAIRQHIEYDGTKFNGYVDMGDNIATADTSIAKEALVFMVVCINGAWKIPVAYFLIERMTAAQKKNLALQCIVSLHGAGMQIVCVTCDGAPTNFAMMQQLGCDFKNTLSLQSTFQHPVNNELIVVFPDPCHMLKLIRNTFGDLKSFTDEHNQIIKWEYLEKLHSLQATEGMHLGNKLRTAHINYNQQKMKVRLAAQILSRSVADSLQYCKDKLKLDDFQNVDATIKFLNIFNDLFDILNSKSLKQTGFKQALCSKNISMFKNKLETCKTYITALKTSKGELLHVGRRKTGFLGFLICINSAQVLYKVWCEDKDLLKYIPCYKLNQDHIELLFGCIRSRGGGNNNPTSRQFQATMKKLLVHCQLRNVTNGNCVALEEISILHVSSFNKTVNSEDVIRWSSGLHRLEDDAIITDEINDHDYVPDIRNITEFSKEVTIYIAGYVVMQLQKSILCHECIRELKASRSMRTDSLIACKDRGGLTYPAKDVITICHECEKIIRNALCESGSTFMNKKFTTAYLTVQVLKKFIGHTLFISLKDHTSEQSPLDNHIVHLLRSICNRYIKIRLHYIAQQAINTSVSMRQVFNKLILFNGQ